MEMVIVVHCSLLAWDLLHIGISDSVAATNFRMHCTKCKETILAPYCPKNLLCVVFILPLQIKRDDEQTDHS